MSIASPDIEEIVDLEEHLEMEPGCECLGCFTIPTMSGFHEGWGSCSDSPEYNVRVKCSGCGTMSPPLLMCVKCKANLLDALDYLVLRCSFCHSPVNSKNILVVKI